jgi:CRISPR/Cas system-associated exonuclease Cas4 (RecB family)
VKGKGQFTFGKTMHAALEKLFQLIMDRQEKEQATIFGNPSATLGTVLAVARTVGELVKPEELDSLYAASWVDDWFDSAAAKEEYRTKGKKILHAYYDIIKEEHIHPLYLEKKFNLKVEDATFRGAIDRVDLMPDGSVRLVDYKTGKPKTDDDIGFEEKQQLLIYQIAALEVLDKKPTMLSFVYLDNGTDIEFLGTGKDLDKIREYMTRTIAQIRKSDFSADPNEFKCKYCDFKDICEFRIL